MTNEPIVKLLAMSFPRRRESSTLGVLWLATFMKVIAFSNYAIRSNKIRYNICMMILVLTMAFPFQGFADKPIDRNNLDDVEIPIELIEREKIVCDRDLYVTAEKTLQQVKKKEVVLVDVRSEVDFNKFRIPGSIHIPLYAIKSKQFLKSKQVVLVNEGTCYSILERECKKLRDMEYHVWILQGGLYCWYQLDYPLDGDMIAAAGLNKITAQAVFNELVYDRWVVIDISDPETSKVGYLIPESISIPYTDDKERFLSGIRKDLDQYKGNPAYSFIIVGESSDRYAQVENVIRKEGYRNIFFLLGGIAEYESFLKKQALFWQKKDKRTITTKRCKTCS